MILLLMTKPKTTPNPITMMIGILKSDNAPIAVEYIPSNRSTKEPLIPGNSIAVLAAQPDKNNTTVVVGVKDVMIDVSAGAINAVIANKTPTTSKTT